MGHLLRGPWVSITFVHPIEDLIQVALSIAAFVFLPHRAVFTPQHHELAVSASVGGKVGDLHNHRAEGTQWMVGRYLDAGVHVLRAGDQGQRMGRAGGAGQLIPAWSRKGFRRQSEGPACGQVRQ